jgi:hypothetical protein
MHGIGVLGKRLEVVHKGWPWLKVELFAFEAMILSFQDVF